MKHIVFEAAVFLKKFPALKGFVKFIYQRIFWVLNRPTQKFFSDYKIGVIAVEGRDSFFGYYDKSPESLNGNILVCSSNVDTVSLPKNADSIFISVVDKHSMGILCEVRSRAFNWQQGARAHWLDDDEFIFNDYCPDNNRYISRTFSVKFNNESRTFDHPVQDSFGKEFFLSINYARLALYSADYGYFSHRHIEKTKFEDLHSDGITHVDFDTGQSRLLLSFAELLEGEEGIPKGVDAHTFNHIMLSPDGKSFIFLHRMLAKGVRHDRLFSFDLVTKRHSLICASKMISHSCWLDNANILTYMKNDGGRIGYWKTDIHSGLRTLIDPLTDTGLGDGHPSVHNGKLISDTYPDKSRMQHLLMFDFQTTLVKELGRFLHGFRYSGQTRCDLHPRFSPSGDRIYFDSVHSGRRRLHFIEYS